MLITNWINRLRVTRGFTVHSPFAYHFIRSCLREKLPYYAFRRDVTDKAGQCLFRVVTYFNPQTVCFIGDSAEARRIIMIACPRAREVQNGADFTYIAANTPLPDDFTVLYTPEASELPPDAMTFTNGHTLIAVRRPGLPNQPFRLRF